MDLKIKLISVFIILILILIVLSIVIYPLLDQDDKICGNEFISIIGKWKLVNTTLMIKNETIKNTCDSEYTIEFFTNGTCNELVDCVNNSWIWMNYSKYNDYIIFGDDPLSDNMDYFQRIFYDVTDFGSRLSLYHAHLMTTRYYLKVK